MGFRKQSWAVSGLTWWNWLLELRGRWDKWSSWSIRRTNYHNRVLWQHKTRQRRGSQPSYQLRLGNRKGTKLFSKGFQGSWLSISWLQESQRALEAGKSVVRHWSNLSWSNWSQMRLFELWYQVLQRKAF